MQDDTKPATNPHVGLFVTCLVDAMRPSIGFACLKLLEDAGCHVDVPAVQTCCGQPAYNSGADNHARDIVKQVVTAFEAYDYVVVRRLLCPRMLKIHAGDLFADEPAWAERHRALAAKTYEIMAFLVDVLDHRPSPVRYDGTAPTTTRAPGCANSHPRSAAHAARRCRWPDYGAARGQ